MADGTADEPCGALAVVEGDLLEAPEEYIAHQTCCQPIRGRGLYATLSRRFPHANLYAERRRSKERGTPGTINVHGDGEAERFVVSMNAQYFPGKPKTSGSDSRQDRLSWFEQCLADIAELQPKSVAFPYLIGCGLAGGRWEADYLPVLRSFARANRSMRVVLYSLPPPG